MKTLARNLEIQVLHMAFHAKIQQSLRSNEFQIKKKVEKTSSHLNSLSHITDDVKNIQTVLQEYDFNSKGKWKLQILT